MSVIRFQLRFYPLFYIGFGEWLAGGDAPADGFFASMSLWDERYGLLLGLVYFDVYGCEI